jgi:hypothetical protein
VFHRHRRKIEGAAKLRVEPGAASRLEMQQSGYIAAHLLILHYLYTKYNAYKTNNLWLNRFRAVREAFRFAFWRYAA